MAQSDKDDFNLDDIHFAEVGLTPLADFSKDVPTADPLAVEQVKAAGAKSAEAANAPDSSSAEASPLEPVDKKAKKKGKKEKKVKEKKSVETVIDSAEGENRKADLLKRLSQTSPYLVILGMTLTALLLGVIFLVIELSRYGFNIRAS